MAQRKSTFVRLSKHELEALTREERQQYMARLFDEAQRQMAANQHLLARPKTLKGDSRQS